MTGYTQPVDETYITASRESNMYCLYDRWLVPDSAAALQGLQGILETCGIAPVATHTQLINNEGLTSIANLGLLDGDNDMLKMAKCMVALMVANGHVNLGTISLRNFKPLCIGVKTARCTHCMLMQMTGMRQQ